MIIYAMNPQTFEIIYQLVGAIGAILGIISFQCKNNKAIFAFQTATSLVFLGQFAMKEAWVAVLINAICSIRNIFYFFTKKPKYKLIGTWAWSIILFTSIFLSICAFKQPVFIAILCAVGTITGTITYYINNGLVIRIFQILVVTPCWLVNDIYFKSIGGIVCEAFIVVSVIVSLVMMRVKGYDEKGVIRCYFLTNNKGFKLHPLYSLFKIEKQEKELSLQFIYHSFKNNYLFDTEGKIKLYLKTEANLFVLEYHNGHCLLKSGEHILLDADMPSNSINNKKHVLIKFTIPYDYIKTSQKETIYFNVFYASEKIPLDIATLPLKKKTPEDQMLLLRY